MAGPTQFLACVTWRGQGLVLRRNHGGEVRQQDLLPLLGPELYTASPWGLAPCPALLWSEEQDFVPWLAGSMPNSTRSMQELEEETCSALAAPLSRQASCSAPKRRGLPPAPAQEYLAFGRRH